MERSQDGATPGTRPAGSARSGPLYLAMSVKCHKASLPYFKECLGVGARVSGKQGRGVLIGTHRWECKERYGEDRETGGDGLPNPCLGYLIPVANGGDCDLQGKRTAVSGWQAESQTGHLPAPTWWLDDQRDQLKTLPTGILRYSSQKVPGTAIW